MKIKLRLRFIFFLIIIALAESVHCQNENKIQISLNAGMSSSGSFGYGETYAAFTSNPEVSILSTSNTRTRNYNFAIGYHLNSSFMIGGSIGAANYGFFYTGDTFLPSGSASNSVFTERYNFRSLEVNLSGEYGKYITSDIRWLVRPGLSWYTNPNENRPRILRIPQKSNNFSATLFTGLEFPVISDIIFINAGISTKLALSNFAAFFDFENTLYPYAIGIQSGILYRFQSD